MSCLFNTWFMRMYLRLPFYVLFSCIGHSRMCNSFSHFQLPDTVADVIFRGQTLLDDPPLLSKHLLLNQIHNLASKRSAHLSFFRPGAFDFQVENKHFHPHSSVTTVRTIFTNVKLLGPLPRAKWMNVTFSQWWTTTTPTTFSKMLHRTILWIYLGSTQSKQGIRLSQWGSTGGREEVDAKRATDAAPV